MAISFSEKQAEKKAARARADSAAASAQRTIATEAAGLAALQAALANGLALPFAKAVEIMDQATHRNPATGAPRGRVVVSGVGKSGLVGRKIAATLASTGTPSFFVHSADAGHGDLGAMVTGDDVIVALSWSGETVELRILVEFARRFGNKLIAVTAMPESSLARQADLVLLLPEATEACPHGLAPTTSTLIQMALGDALAIALLEARGFTAEEFHAFHPRGRLGANFTFVRDIMHAGKAMPLARLGTAMSEAIVRMTEKRLGCLGVTDSAGKLLGIITDGDLRRHLGPELLSRKVDDVMTPSPKTIGPDALVGAALAAVNEAKITVLFVVENDKPVGVVHMHDLLRIGVA